MIGTFLALMALAITPTDSTVVKAATQPVCSVQTQFSFDVDSAAVFIGDSTVSPHPSAAVDNPPNLVQFVVDANGRVEPNTFLALKVTDSTLVRDAQASLYQWRFSSAVEGQCRVPQLVQTPISR